MKPQSKLDARQKEEQQIQAGEQQVTEKMREFASPEEMLRHDSLHTPVPPSIAYRLDESIQHEGGAPAASPAPWWKRLFGGQK